MRENMSYLFSVWLISSNMISSSIPFPAHSIIYLFILSAKIYLAKQNKVERNRKGKRRTPCHQRWEQKLLIVLYG
jgi:hypothetical protein